MAHHLVQATAAQLGQGEIDEVGNDLWSERGGGIAVVRYPGKGAAYFWGPIPLGNPNKSYYEVQYQNAAVQAEVESRANSSELLKTAARTDGLLRAWMAITTRPRIKDSVGRIVGYMPAHVIAGTSPASSFLDGEDPDAAQELADLGDVP